MLLDVKCYNLNLFLGQNVKLHLIPGAIAHHVALGLLICTRKACLIKCSTDVETHELKFELAQFSLKPTSLMQDMENLLLNIGGQRVGPRPAPGVLHQATNHI